MNNNIRLIECPRDAMQGWKDIIATEKKIEYINALLKVGFHTLDMGSFVSAKAVPQMADTRAVIGHLSMVNSNTKLLTIIANVRGAEEAVAFDEITYLGFPFSISPTFQLRNTNSSIEQSFLTVEKIQELCLKNKKELVVYISMGFGNPYGDDYNDEIVMQWVNKIAGLGIKIISLADTVGLAQPAEVFSILNKLIPLYSDVEFGVHLHSSVEGRQQKIEAALQAGCKRFDGALKGIGGCPFANDELVGNIDTAWLISYLKEKKMPLHLHEEALQIALVLADKIFI